MYHWGEKHLQLPLRRGGRAAKALGYRKIITYTLDTEPGTSLRAAGWTCAGLAGGKRWTGQRRPAACIRPLKLRYEKELDPPLHL